MFNVRGPSVYPDQDMFPIYLFVVCLVQWQNEKENLFGAVGVFTFLVVIYVWEQSQLDAMIS